MTGAARELPRYKCHKEVWALKIKAILPHSPDRFPRPGALIVSEEQGYGEIEVTPEYLDKHDPKVGGYWVVYEDNYQSYSPAKAFEEGYTRI